MKKAEDCVIGIAGLGLMGGAFAMALRECGAASPGKLLACDSDSETLKAALGEKVIDQGFSSAASMLPRCDLVFLCLSPRTLLDFMEKNMGFFRSGALITDIAGIKSGIQREMRNKLRKDLDYIPGHPMAGSEKNGYANAGQCGFKGRNYILTPLEENKKENLDFLSALIYRMGFGRITKTSAEEHDRKIAFTSQLCHVIAAALIDCEEDTEITRFGGGSFEDLTRIAMLNVPLWTELFIENRTELSVRIEQFEKSLDTLKFLIAEKDAAELEKKLGTVRDRRGSMT